ncbi:TPA: hypothetical protein WMP85_002172 [Neisseria gonorrhoeae]
MTQPDDHTTLEFTDYTELTRDLGGEPITLGRDVEGHPIALDPFQVVHISGTRPGKAQTTTPTGEAR